MTVLHYRIKHSDQVDFSKALPVEYDKLTFLIRIENQIAEIFMQDRYQTFDSARAFVEPYLRAWELSSALTRFSDEFEFYFYIPEVFDRSSAPPCNGSQDMSVKASDGTTPVCAEHSEYPAPPINLACNGPVILMLNAYKSYRKGNKALIDAAYYCLAIIDAVGGGRERAAEHFGIEVSVLNKLAELTVQTNATSSHVTRSTLLPNERSWLHFAMIAIIRRAAESAYEPRAYLVPIKMTDLPSISLVPAS